jgi:hypothetical protein
MKTETMLWIGGALALLFIVRSGQATSKTVAPPSPSPSPVPPGDSGLNLVHGHHYEATINVGLLAGMVSNETVAQKLTDAGFTDVIVTGSGAIRTASGIWNGATENVALPNQIVEVHEI